MNSHERIEFGFIAFAGFNILAHQLPKGWMRFRPIRLGWSIGVGALVSSVVNPLFISKAVPNRSLQRKVTFGHLKGQTIRLLPPLPLNRQERIIARQRRMIRSWRTPEASHRKDWGDRFSNGYDHEYYAGRRLPESFKW